MLTGDNKETAEKIAKDIEITEVIANVLPNEKTNIIKKLKQENNYVMMCGDGINDSPALAIADIGVSVKSGTDIAMDSSDVILTKNDSALQSDCKTFKEIYRILGKFLLESCFFVHNKIIDQKNARERNRKYGKKELV